MFTINIYLRFALTALCLVGGVLMTVFLGFWYAFPFLLLGIGLLVSYILLGTIQSAAALVQQMDFDGAEKRLRLTLKPNWLYVTNRAYFYILKGTIAQQKGRMDEAETYLLQAQNLDLPTDNEKAAVELQLANIAATKNKWNQAKIHFRTLKQLKVTEQALKDQIKQFEKALNNRGQMNVANRMSMGMGKQQRGGGGMPIKPGGKRRRPRMR